MGLRLLAYGETWDEFRHQITQQTFDAEQFRIDFRSLAKQKRRDPQSAILEIADSIPFRPNLSYPQHRFMILERDDGYWFGEVMTESDQSYNCHDDKPYRTSASLPSRLSRALVNLVAPQAQTLLNLCCGTGSIMLEAHALGMTTYGVDWNQKMVGMTRENLKYFGYIPDVEKMDVRHYQRTADALITDLPYGRNLEEDETIIREIFAHARNLAPIAIWVAASDLSDRLNQAGYSDIAVYPIIKTRKFTRYIHVTRNNDV